ncbi:hypothetical protein CEXT_237651 [Caerostris extrusa]|uniref:Uncharacterized protein n=1 Tax=Caerostris extrusa TaxID=172846 RepID=A0AAV4RMJ9_CAEEX|nr:hypothetical protein CEXT_237651 [Caerostris extrusa]
MIYLNPGRRDLTEPLSLPLRILVGNCAHKSGIYVRGRNNETPGCGNSPGEYIKLAQKPVICHGPHPLSRMRTGHSTRGR